MALLHVFSSYSIQFSILVRITKTNSYKFFLSNNRQNRLFLSIKLIIVEAKVSGTIKLKKYFTILWMFQIYLIQIIESIESEIMLIRDFRQFSKDAPRKLNPAVGTLRPSTSQKRIIHQQSLFPHTKDDYIRVGAYKFREEDIIGRGFSSRVYKGVNIHENSHQNYAVKVINIKKFKNVQMLDREIEISKQLDHPNIIKFYQYYKTQQYYYIITEYCEDGDLSQYIKKNRNICEKEAEEIIKQITSGCLYLFKKSILHRDLKPANIMKMGSQWKIGDFGFSIFCHQEAMFDRVNVGTPLYMPPQALKLNKYSPKSDIFALGIMLYEILTGKTPWPCKTQKQLISKMTNIALPRLQNLENKKLQDFYLKACCTQENRRMKVCNLEEFMSSCENLSIEVPKLERKTSIKKNISLANLQILRDTKFESESTEISQEESEKIIPESLRKGSKMKYLKITNNKPITSLSQKSIFNKNTRHLLNQLQFCRLIYYMIKNIHHTSLSTQFLSPFLDANKVQNSEKHQKMFLALTLFKILLRSIKQLEDPKQFFQHILNITTTTSYFQSKQYQSLAIQITNYAKRYEKGYLDILKSTDISIIRIVNRKFPQLSCTALNKQIYLNLLDYFRLVLRGCLHHIEAKVQSIPNSGLSMNCFTNLNNPEEKFTNGQFQYLDSLYLFCRILKDKQNVVEKMSNKQNILVWRSEESQKLMGEISNKIVLDYSKSKANIATYYGLRDRVHEV